MPNDRFMKVIMTVSTGLLLFLGLTAARASREPTQWEHQLIFSSDPVEVHDEANTQGADGWQFAGCMPRVLSDSTGQRGNRWSYYCILKRPKG